MRGRNVQAGMEIMMRRAVVHALHATLALTIAGAVAAPAAAQPAGAVPSRPNARIIERILVKVNGEIITQSDLEDRQIAAIRARGVQPSTNAELFQLLEEVTPSVIANLLEEVLLIQRGKELGYQLSDDQFQDFLDNLKEENGIETDEEFIELLDRQEGMSLDDFRRLTERQMLASQVQSIEILNRVAITDVEAREYYEAHIDEFTEPASVTLREIIIAVPPTGGLMADQRARAMAAAVMQRLVAGEDFATVAAEVSDASSARDGGLIGPFQLSEIAEAIQELITTLEVGAVSDLRRTPQGYQILLLEDVTDDTAQPFEEVRDRISENVFSDRRLEEYAKYLDELREEAIIEWKSDELLEAYDQFRSRAREAASQQ